MEQAVNQEIKPASTPLTEKLAVSFRYQRYLDKAFLASQKLGNFGTELKLITSCDIALERAKLGFDANSTFKQIFDTALTDPDLNSLVGGKYAVLSRLADAKTELGLDTQDVFQALKNLSPHELENIYNSNTYLARAYMRLGQTDQALDLVFQRRPFYGGMEPYGPTQEEFRETYLDILKQRVGKQGLQKTAQELFTINTGKLRDKNSISRYLGLVILDRIAYEQGLKSDFTAKIDIPKVSKEDGADDLLEEISLMKAEKGEWDQALQTADFMRGVTKGAVTLSKLAIIAKRQGHDPKPILTNAVNLVNLLTDQRNKELKRKNAQSNDYWIYSTPSSQAEAFAALAAAFKTCGLDPKPLIEKALETASVVSERPEWVSRTYEYMARNFARGGMTEEAEWAVAKTEYERCQIEIALILAKQLHSQVLTYPQINTLNQDEVKSILSSGNKAAIEAIGYFGLDKYFADKQAALKPKDAVLISKGTVEGSSYNLNRSINAPEELSEDAKKALKIAREIYDTYLSHPADKIFLETIAANLSYETASSQLLSLLQTETKQGSINQARMMRILKGLIEIENPRGRDFATRLFADANLPIHYRDYLANKLFDAGYWDKNLEDYLKKQLSSAKDKPLLKNKQDKILTLLIRELGLTPDLNAFQALEQPGILQADTLEGRVQEIKDSYTLFSGKSRDELINILNSNSRLATVYYLLKGGEYRYSVVNDYSFDKFYTIIQKVDQLQINQSVVRKFYRYLTGETHPQDAKWYQFWKLKKRPRNISPDLSTKDTETVISDLLAGRPLVLDKQRSFRFSASLEEGSDLEQTLKRLDIVWKQEFKSLLIARQLGRVPETVAESMHLLNNPQASSSLKSAEKLIKRLRIDNENFDLKSFQQVAKDLRTSLRERFKDNRDKRQQIEDLSDTAAICEYLKDFLPSSPATSEWMNHLSDTIISLQEIEASAKKGGAKGKSTELELTFLDKNLDFVRALRFADAARCCFNSSKENFRARTYEYTTRLNKDPLSFIMDLREADSRQIMGFVFGRMGLNPETGRPIIMLNGIYSQRKNPPLVQNILNLIEQNMGKRFGAESIVIASKYGGGIKQPEGYHEVQNMEILALRALSDNKGRPEKAVYDDIGNTANGVFQFSGYAKTLS